MTTKSFKYQGRGFSDLFRLEGDGIWYAKGHEDFAYLKNDDTDWASLQNVSFWFRH